ncbi:hypothetical protein GCM10009665_73190 [Kitasatospora nipponensis]|uniref:Ester cyclase n=1 Tax=Kitasatospora nipponensis TaxID=258049 RepID=A0ABN1X315_9ACTN
MTFVQIIDCKTDQVDEMNRLLDTWIELTRGRRTATHSIVGSDRADARHVVEIVEFPSYEEAMRNSRMPETNRIFSKMVALCDEPPTFVDLDVVRDDQFDKSTVRSFFDAIGTGDVDLLRQLISPDYRDNDPADETGPLTADEFVAKMGTYGAAFDAAFTVRSQCAEGDLISSRWTWEGTHTGAFRGLPATHRQLDTTGTTTFRLEHGRLAEGWWNWDNMRLLRQLGLIQPSG